MKLPVSPLAALAALNGQPRARAVAPPDLSDGTGIAA